MSVNVAARRKMSLAKQGDKNPKCKIKDVDLPELARLRQEENLTWHEIGERFGVTYYAVRRAYLIRWPNFQKRGLCAVQKGE